MGLKHRFGQSLGGSIVALALSVSPAWAEKLHDWSFNTSNNELTFSLSDQVYPEFFLLSEPPRLVLDIPSTVIGDVKPEQIYNGAVRTIRVAQHTADDVRIVIELAPEIVLSSEQADIQFDDVDGQRHWRFRPLIDDGTVRAAAQPSTPSRSGDISLSAENLRLASEGSTTLPIDPYEAESSTTVVSVPPLEESVNVPPWEEVVSVPPLADLPENNAASNIAAAVEVPELPPMTVPELEAASLDDSAVISVAAADNERSSSLPNLEANTGDAAANAESVAPVISSDETSAEQTAVNAAPRVEIATPEIPIATALAPVEVSSLPEKTTAAVERESVNVPQTVQQSVAERTILQTELPEPLQFGQPLPKKR